MKQNKSKIDFLKEVWGYSEFRDKQESIVDHVLLKKDTLVIMPTGGGKSLCYQLPALMMDGLTIVISPLIALMNDQVSALKSIGVPVAAIHSNIPYAELDNIIKELKLGKYKLLYVSPEKINTPRFRSELLTLPVKLVAIDEAHCVSIWGNDFRPDYVQLHELRDLLPLCPFIALTATADHATQVDICKQLHLREYKSFVSSFERHNITTTVQPAENRMGVIKEFLKNKSGQSGIVYCLSRKQTEQLTSKLSAMGYMVGTYHAGLSAEERNDVQMKFQEDKLQIVCATIAFGMGIDKSNIRWVIHYSLPKNLEGYYQEIGRSGRDGKDANSLLFYSWADYSQLKSFIDASNAGDDFKTVQYAKLDRMWEFATANDCRTNVVLNYFGEFRSTKCNHCDNCLSPPKSVDGTLIAQKALSAIARSNEDVPMGLLIDVLRGSFRAEVTSINLDRIKTFGVGRDTSYVNWKIYITQLVNQGYIRIDYTDNSKLKLTPLSKHVLFENVKVKLVDLQQIDFQAPKVKAKVKTRKELFVDELITLLKEWRTQKAAELQVPSYVVFADKVFEQIAVDIPLFYNDLKMIDGIGQVKLNQYGDDILSIIHNYIIRQQYLNNIQGSTHIITYMMYRDGLNPDAIASERKLSVSTIYGHLAHLYAQDMDLDLLDFVSEKEVEEVSTAYIQAGKVLSVSAVSEYLLAPMDINKIRLALAIYLKRLKR
jgi:ATP-dependent DNA helicase RecQ